MYVIELFKNVYYFYIIFMYLCIINFHLFCARKKTNLFSFAINNTNSRNIKSYNWVNEFE